MIGIMIQTAFLVIAIAALQKLLGDKLHAYVRYGLWLLVVLRLMIPVNFIDSPFSMLRVAGKMTDWQEDLQGNHTEKQVVGFVNQDVVTAEDDLLQAGKTPQGAGSSLSQANSVQQGTGIYLPQGADIAYSEDVAEEKHDSAVENIGRSSDELQAGYTKQTFYAIWLIGSLLVGGFLGFSHFCFRQRLSRFREAYTTNPPNLVKKTLVPVYRVKGLETPCLVGLARPAIYIGTDIDMFTDYSRYTITHEEVHYLHRDHVWAFVRAALVTVYWFHPFVWMAAILSARDGEIACDYGTVRRLGQEERFAYGEMLLSLSKNQRGRRVYSYGTMLRPSKSELKRRILQLTQVNGSRAWAGILAVMLMVIAAGCAFTGASEADGGNGGQGVVVGSDNEADSGTVDEPADNSENTVADSGDAQDENGEPDEKEGLSDNEDTYNMEPRQLEAKPAEISGNTPFGADGPILDYAGGMGTDKGSRIIFHDYFGLIVYDLDNREITRSLDLVSIGCDKTQGDDACQVAVSEDGTTVWLHPMSKRYMYRYEVEDNLLYQNPLVKTFELDLETKELFNRYSTSEEESTYWHSNYLYEEYKDAEGLHEAYIYLYVFNTQDTSDGGLVLRNLECACDDMMFILFKDGAEVQDNAKSSEEASENTEIPEEIKHKRFQDNQTNGASGAENADGFPYNYSGYVEYTEIKYGKPCNYTSISGTFGGRTHPITGEVIVHDGIDFVAAEGTDITAAADGVVYETGYSAKYGNYVVLLHVNGEMTYYCQCKEVIVKQDAQVKRGDKIATVGQTGQATGPHLHFALSRSGWFINPEDNMEVVLNLN